jgi:hypothetical protein
LKSRIEEWEISFFPWSRSGHLRGEIAQREIIIFPPVSNSALERTIIFRL